jgi:hypothetical protein
MRDTVVAVTFTNDSGKFTIILQEPGTFSLQTRRVGWHPVETEPFRLRALDTLAISIDMARQVALLDTVLRVETRGVFNMTPGAEFARKHFALGVGTFVAGLDIQRTGLTLSEYLGKMPGLRLAGTIAGIPAIPGENRTAWVSDAPSRCLYGRIDRSSVLHTLMINSGRWIDDILDVRNIMMVEVYLDRTEVPREWQNETRAEEIYGRNFHEPRRPPPANDYVIGHSGVPRISAGVLSDDAQSFGTTRLLTDDFTGARLSNSTITSIPSGCGFVQIWTRSAW